MADELRSAVIVPILEASATVDPWRERTCEDRPSIGIPAHVTLVFPFVPATAIDPALVADLAALFLNRSTFRVEFAEVRRFPTTSYLAPDPAEPFIELTHAIVDRYPDYPPYEGRFDRVIPHLTVAHGEHELLDVVEADVEPSLPIVGHVDAALLIEEVEPNWRCWRTHARLPLTALAVR